MNLTSSVLIWFVLNNLIWASLFLVALLARHNTSLPRILKTPPAPEYENDLVEASNDDIVKAFNHSNDLLKNQTPAARPVEPEEEPVE